ncbi:MAG: 7,8-dihydroneopterin aldolase [Candidatus Pelagibacterales bacterium]|jgi:dihydroneopterin aldolase|nr:MAG: 7,8-dihydroneopterin aldolase [Pelagibacterales bacterium]|tara:strand:+ start:195 stop:623 length:429 start_codon:yes stop_codon:yes gene_type:complete
MTARNILKLSELRSETDLINPNSGYDLIFLNDFMIDANIGVYKHEKIKSQPLRINIIAKVKNPKKINDDKLYSVVCYNQISKKIKKIIKSGHTILLEKLAEKIFQECFKNKRIQTMKIRLEKLDAIQEAESAGIEVERSRSE